MTLDRVKKISQEEGLIISLKELEELKIREQEECISFEELLMYRETHKKLTHV